MIVKTEMTKIAILGSEGMLGKELKKVFPNAHNFDIAKSINVARTDLTDIDCLEGSLASDYEWVINAAAYTDVDGAETPQGKNASFNVNVIGPENLSVLSKKYGFKIIHFSTAYVFDGGRGSYQENDKTNPLGAYAKHKLFSEMPILDAGGIVLRTDVLYGRNGKNFVDSIRRFSRERKVLEVVNDQIGSPTYAGDLAEMTKSIIFSGTDHREKVYHATNRGSCSRADLARKIIAIMGVDCKVVNISTDYYNSTYRNGLLTAERPKNSSLSVGRLNNHFPIRNWEEALKDYIFSEN